MHAAQSLTHSLDNPEQRPIDFVLRISIGLLLILLALFATTLVLARSSEQAHPAIGTRIVIDGLAVHVRDTGPPEDDPAARVLLLLHGASTSLLDYESSLLPALSTAYRVVSIDRPGHGYSERGATWPSPYDQADTAARVLEHLGIENAIWVGHSWAGSVVLAAALEQQERVEAGILLAGATHPWAGGSAWHAELAARPIVGHAFSWLLIEPAGRLMLDAAIASVFAPEQTPSDYVDTTGVALSLRPETYRANAADLTRLSAHLDMQSSRYATIDLPMLSITATDDEVVPAWNHDARLAKVVPDLKQLSLEGAGHAFHHTRTNAVAMSIREFVDTLHR